MTECGNGKRLIPPLFNAAGAESFSERFARAILVP
jgi:hypothetical protein